MTDLVPGDILIGALGFIDIIHPDGSFVERRPVTDDSGAALRVNGIAVDPSGHYQIAKSPPGATTYVLHDIAYIPDGSGFIEIVQVSPGTAQLWKLNLSGDRVQTWPIQPDPGWTTGLLRVDVAPDAKTVYYTDSGRTIFRFDISTPEGTQLPPFDQLPADSPNIYAGFKLLADGGVVVAMTKAGNGPKNAICLDNDRTMFWTDEINASPPGEYHVYKRSLDDDGDVLVTYPSPGYLDYGVTCLACYLTGDPRYGVQSTWFSNVGAPANVESWTRDLARLGVRRVRIALEMPPDHNDQNYIGWKAFVQGCADKNLFPLVVLNSGISGGNINTFADQAGAVAADLVGIADDFEIWNEPNGAQPLDRATWASLQRDAAEAVRGSNSNANIVTGGLLFSDEVDATGWLTAPLNDPGGPGLYTWMDEYASGLRPWDYLGVHLYFAGGENQTIDTPTGRSARSTVEGIRSEQNGHGDGAPIWVTEFGDPRECSAPACAAGVNEPSDVEQAANLDLWFNMLGLAEFQGVINAVYWFSHHRVLDDSPDAQPNTYFGLMNDDVVIDPNEHWQSWGRLASRIRFSG